MPPTANGHVLGLAELQRNLESLGIKVAPAASRRALYTGATIFRDEARRLVPVESGALRKAIVAETRGSFAAGVRKPYAYYARVSISRRAFVRGRGGKARRIRKVAGDQAYERGEIYPRNYAHLVEFGTRPHSVAPGAKLSNPASQRPMFHPGARARPFMRPAFDGKRAAAETAIRQRLWAEVSRAAVRRAVRAGAVA